MHPTDLQFHASLSQAATDVEDLLSTLLPPPETQVVEAMRHAVLSGGKRLRALLVVESARLFRVPQVQALRAAAAVECIHAYSLVHDDMPCMDDDDMRRGKPTVHKLWDEATAVLTGDALQAFAFEILAAPQTAQDPNIRLKLITRLAQASGALGMVGGQAMDIAAETAKAPLDLQSITQLQSLKTGALISWSAEAGAVLGKSDTGPLNRYATALGLAFQIRDDILDVEGDAAAAGKALRKDAVAGKATFVSLLGLEAARRRAEELADEAAAALEPYSSAAKTLQAAARFVVNRGL